jgi:hypothetical protein
MSEASSLSARESLTALGCAGFHVEVVDANPALPGSALEVLSQSFISRRISALTPQDISKASSGY